MNGQETVAIHSGLGENYEPQSKRPKVENDGEVHMNFQTVIPSKNTELG